MNAKYSSTRSSVIFMLLIVNSTNAFFGLLPLPSKSKSAKTQSASVTHAKKDSDKAAASTTATPTLEFRPNDPSAFSIGILGDLHMDPREMDDYAVARDQWLKIFNKEREVTSNLALVSLGDLGESKNCDHNDQNPSELFAGTTLCHEMAADFLGSFDEIPYEVIGGNHDLEGIDEFKTDEANLEAFMKAHGKPTPQFCREIAHKTLLVGLCSTVFRDAKYTSHEVIIDDAQIAWFEDLLKRKPASDGWKIYVFSHAPPNGSGLRVLQENHVINGCCWLNHSDEENCRKFIELVREHSSIKAWFSGHFHLGQDYEDSITFPTTPVEGPDPNRGSCVFAQTSVVRSGTSRDGRQQSRLLRGNSKGFEICTVDHQNEGAIRVDATIALYKKGEEVGIYTHEGRAHEHEDYIKVKMPEMGDDGYIEVDEDEELSLLTESPIEEDSVSWWRLKCGRVLGMTNGMLLEYDRSTLAPLGLVVSADELVGKQIAVVDSGIDGAINLDASNAETDGEEETCEQAVIMFDENNEVTVIQPNEDGSYWRKIVRNKIARMKERRREKAAMTFAQEQLCLSKEEAKEVVQSNWGPYTSTSGFAKTTKVPGQRLGRLRRVMKYVQFWNRPRDLSVS